MDTRQNRQNRTATMSTLQRLGRLFRDFMPAGVTPSQKMLQALNSHRPGMQGNPVMYAGTVTPKVKAKRRAANKVARVSRRANRR